MKIGIFTYFQTNYGAVLQAYALQKYLQNQPGTEVEIIDFTTPEHLEGHKVCKRQSLKNPVVAIAYYFFTLIHYRQLKRRVTRTRDFKNKYFHFTRRFSSMKEALKNHPIEDIYITGSDQVFNPNGKYVPLYYLGFDKGNGKKVAYAPSFGISEFNDDITQKIKEYIQDFDFLSCRELTGADYLSSITGHDVPVVVDPVLLHNADEWGKVAVTPRYKKDYIFIYDLNGADNLIKIAKDIQRNTGLPIVCLTSKREKIYPVNKQTYDAGPAEFVGWIKNASYVVTDSFHGTVFSLIFRKEFFTFIAVERTSSRIRCLLDKVGRGDRIIKKDELSSFNFLSYSDAEVVSMSQLSNISKSYIAKFLTC